MSDDDSADDTEYGVSSQVEQLTSTLQDTNRNLKVVDRLLGRYRELGEQKAAAVDALRADLLRNEERLWNDIEGSPDRLRSRHYSEVYSRHRRPSSSPPRQRNHRKSDRADGGGGGDGGRPSRSYDDLDLPRHRIHSLHQSIRDLTSGQRRLKQQLDDERRRSIRLELQNQRTFSEFAENSAGNTDTKESLQQELELERQRWKSKHDSLRQISSQLKQALLDRRRDNPSSSLTTADGPQPFYNMLVIGDGDKHRLNHLTTSPSHRVHDHIDNQTMIDADFAQRETMSDSQLTRNPRLPHERRRSHDVIARGGDDYDAMWAELRDARNKIEQLQKDAETSTTGWKSKIRKLKWEMEKQRQQTVDAESRYDEVHREVESLRAQRVTCLQQFEQLKKQFTDLISVRVQSDEHTRVRDVKLNQLKSAKLGLEQDLRDSRQTIDRLETELRSTRDRMYLSVEEKNRLDDQLNSMQSSVFTSDHELRSIQKELQDASIAKSQLSAELAKMAADNHDLKMKLDEQQKLVTAGHEEVVSLRSKLQQVVTQETLQAEWHVQQDSQSKDVREFVHRLKTEYAEQFAELQTLKLELTEERANSERYRKQADILRQELDSLLRQLAVAEEDSAYLRHQYLKLHNELINSTVKHRDIIDQQFYDL